MQLYIYIHAFGIEVVELKRLKGERAMEEVPDDIVQHILSFLETKDAVRTCVLSKRWKHLWVSLPVIDIDSNSFSNFSSFSAFVYNVLRIRSAAETSLTQCKFWFDISNPIYCSDQMSIDSDDLFEPLVSRVIYHVTTHGVHYLSLWFPRIVDNLYLLFSALSPSYLQLYELVILPSFLDFATLTTLHLVKCSFIIHDGDGECDAHFDPFKGCVYLTHFLISDCRIPSKVRTFEISAPCLTSLTIYSMHHDRNISPDCKILLSSTEITTFTFLDSHILQFSFASLPSITSVDIAVAAGHYLFHNVPAATRMFISRLIGMFRAIGDAEIVTLSFQTMSILSLSPPDLRQPSPFTGTNILKVKVPREPPSITLPVDVITFLLNGSPATAFTLEFLKEQGRDWTADFDYFKRWQATAYMFDPYANNIFYEFATTN